LPPHLFSVHLFSLTLENFRPFKFYHRMLCGTPILFAALCTAVASRRIGVGGVNWIRDDCTLPSSENLKSEHVRNICTDRPSRTTAAMPPEPAIGWPRFQLCSKLDIIRSMTDCLDCSRFPQTVADCRRLHSHCRLIALIATLTSRRCELGVCR